MRSSASGDDGKSSANMASGPETAADGVAESDEEQELRDSSVDDDTLRGRFETAIQTQVSINLASAMMNF